MSPTANGFVASASPSTRRRGLGHEDEAVAPVEVAGELNPVVLAVPSGARDPQSGHVGSDPKRGGGLCVELRRFDLSKASETEALALSVEDSGGVRFLPAFMGLGAPWWEGDARGVFSGISGGTTKAHLVRAVLDSIAFRVRDVLEACWQGEGAAPDTLRVDGGLTKNRYLVQRQADLLGMPVELGPSSEATATGAAALAGIAIGRLDEGSVREYAPAGGVFEPRSAEDERETEYARWLDWLGRARELR